MQKTPSIHQSTLGPHEDPASVSAGATTTKLPQDGTRSAADAARDYIARGFCPLPLAFRSKAPQLKKWTSLRVTLESLDRYFPGKRQNIGVLLGEPSNGLSDVDLDNPAAVKLASYFLPKTSAVFGRLSKPRSHWLYKVQGLKTQKFATRTDGMLVEVRSTGTQTVVPPSVHPSGELVTWDETGDPSVIPASQLIDAVSKLAGATLIALHWPARGARNEAALALSGALLRCGWSEQEAELFLEAVAFAGNCEDVEGKVKTVTATAGKLKAGSPVTGLTHLAELIGAETVNLAAEWLHLRWDSQSDLAGPPKDLKELIKREVAKLNQRYALVRIGDKVGILDEEARNAEGERDFAVLSCDSWRLWMRNRKVPGKKLPLSEVWLSHPDRRSYEGIVFAPAQDEVHGYYNTWRGWAVEPNPYASCDLFLAHLRDNVARGNEEHYRWVLGWLADIVQRPNRKIGTSLGLRGLQGTGKTIVGHVMGTLLGVHYTLVDSPRYVTGQFNSHMMRCLLLHADEAFFAGDKKAEGTLKGLVTSDNHLIEFKGKEPFQVRNYVRLLVTGNADWLVPAGKEERRFTVLEMGEGAMQDRRYFGAMFEELKNGGYGKLLEFLQHLDYSDIPIERPMETPALYEQKLSSLSPEEAWWLDILGAGILPGDKEGNGQCAAPVLYRHYVERTGKVGTSHKSTETKLGIFFRRHIPGVRRDENGRYVEDPRNEIVKRCSIWIFPPLAECREAFQRTVRQQSCWDAPYQWTPEEAPDEL